MCASLPALAPSPSKTLRLIALFLIAACSDSTSPSASPPLFSQQGSKLVGTGAVGGTRQGTSVSLSADGNTALIGGAGDNGFIGAAWIFTRP
jgi:hypothetical protein